jgi:hypothetical protein
MPWPLARLLSEMQGQGKAAEREVEKREFEVAYGF